MSNSGKEKSNKGEFSENGGENQNDAQGIIPAPDGGYGWVILIASFFVSFILDGVMYSFGILLTEIKVDMMVQDDTANLLSSFNTGFLFCSGPIVAGLSNKFGCRSVVMGGAIVTALMYILTAFSPTITFMLVTYGVIGGISTGCTYIASLIIIADYFDKKRGIATGITMAGSGVGSFVFAPFIGFMIHGTDWKIAMAVCGALIFQTCICGALLKPLNPIDGNEPKPKKIELKSLNQIEVDGNNNLASGSEPGGDNNGGRVVQTFHGSMYSLNNESLPFYKRNECCRLSLSILKEMSDFKLLGQNWAFLLITLSNFFVFTGYFTPFLYLTDIAKNLDEDLAPWLLSTIGIVNIPARMIFGFVADRKFISAINLNAFSVLLGTISLFFFDLLSGNIWTLFGFSFVFAIGAAGMNSLTTVYLCDMVGLKKFGNATGIINLFRGFGCFLGPYAAGLIQKQFDNEIYCFYFSAGCFAIGLALAIIVCFMNVIIDRCMIKEEERRPKGSNNNDSEINKNLLNQGQN